MLIDYNLQTVFTKSLDLVDLGNTTIRATHEATGEEYYIVIKTIAGKTAILRFGPVLAELKIPLDSFNLDYQKIDYSEKKIKKSINAYINDPKKLITAAEEVTDFEAIEAIPEFSVMLTGEWI